MDGRPAREIAADEPTEVVDTAASEDWPVAEQYRIESGASTTGPPTDEETIFLAPRDGSPPAQRRVPRGPVAGALVGAAAFVGAVILGALVLQARDGSASPDAPASASGVASEQAPGTIQTTPTTTGARAALPDLTGMSLATARQRLEELGLRSQVERIVSDAAEGEVVRHAPAAGATPADGAMVVLTVSRGTPAAVPVRSVEVPEVVGLPSPDAVAALREAGLGVRIRSSESDEGAGTVIRQIPAADEEVRKGTDIVLVVARERRAAPTAIQVPDVVGLSAAEARARLRALDLRVSIERVRSSDPSGTVVEQAPRQGVELRQGGTVTLTVSVGPALVEVPDVTGLDEESARLELEAAGFQTRVTDEPTTDPAQDGIVVSQTPAAGSRGDEGAVVVLVVARAG